MSSKSKGRKKRTPKPEHLLVRYGGMGDTMFLTSVAAVLSKDHSVTMAIPEHQVSILDGNPHVSKIIPLKRFGPYPVWPNGIPVNLYQDKLGDWHPIEYYYKQLATGELNKRVRVTDYFGIIEGNGRNPSAKTGNSDYGQVYDLHLSWAGLDPARVPDKMKRPVYCVSKSEQEWAEDFVKDMPRPLILWQGNGSAPAKTYYRNSEDCAKVLKATGGTIIAWDPAKNCWIIFQPGEPPIIPPEGMHPIRLSGALVSVADLVVTADTFVSHLAEAIGKRHITFYCTFSAWLYSQYYQHERSLDLIAPGYSPERPCKCHVISDARCPRREEDARSGLVSHKHNMLANLSPADKQKFGIPADIFPVPEGDDTPPVLHPGFKGGYLQSVMQEFHALRFAEPYCSEGLDLAAVVLDELGVSE